MPSICAMQISTSSRKAQPPLLPRKAKGFRRDGVGLRIAKPATAITLLGDDRARTLARVEAAAAGCTVSIAGAGAGDELLSRSGAGGTGRCLDSGNGSTGAGRAGRCFSEQGVRRVRIGLRIAKPATAITLLGDYGAGAFPRIKAAAGGSAIGIAGAGAGDKLLSRSGAGGTGRYLDGGDGSTGAGRAGRCFSEQGVRRVRIGLRITKPAAAIAFLGDYGAGAFPRIEAAAGGSAIGIVSARTGDELCALTDDQHSH
jgi:hypothetical protein